MDYKYIEQLMERYWNCETSLEEEQILRTFFAQTDVPVHLLKYKALFAYAKSQHESECLGEDFDNRILQSIHTPVVKARPLTLASRFSGLYKAAAAVALICLMGGIGQQILRSDRPADYEETGITNADPQIATTVSTKETQVSMADSTQAAAQKKKASGLTK